MLNEASAAVLRAAAAPAPAAWAVHKFGGSSLADAACFRQVAAIVGGLEEPLPVDIYEKGNQIVVKAAL